MPSTNLWEDNVTTSTVGAIRLRLVRITDAITSETSYAVEYSVGDDLLAVKRWLVLLTSNPSPIPGAVTPDVPASHEGVIAALKQACDAMKRKHDLLAQVTTTTITSGLLASIVAEVAGGEI